MAKQNKPQSKTINTGTLERAKRLKGLTWFIPVVIALFFLFAYLPRWIESIAADPSIETFIGIALFIFLVTLVLSVLPVAIARGAVNIYRDRLIENASFITVNDFNYWREKLSNLSPPMISFIADLEVEPDKDRIASLLYYEHHNIIRGLADGTYTLIGSDEVINTLLPHERYFLKHMVEHPGTIEEYEEWEKIIIEDAISGGYISTRSIPGMQTPVSEPSKVKNALGCLSTIVIFGALMFWLYSWYFRVSDSMLEALDAAPENLSLAEQITFLNGIPNIWLQVSETMLLFVVLFGLFFYPIGIVIGNFLTQNLIKPFRRTAKGNEEAELIFGIKNFIHEFTNLREADKRAIVVWDEFVIYAVTLEENTSIVEEIRRLNQNVKAGTAS